MCRSHHRITAAIAVLGAGLLGGVTEPVSPAIAAAVDGPKVAWNISMFGPKRGLTYGFEDMARVVAESTGFTPGKLPVVEGSALPFLPTPTIFHAVAMRDGYYTHPAPNADMARWGATLIMQGPFASFEFVGRGAPPLTLAGWKGKRVRATGGDARAMQLLGAAPSSLPSTEYYNGIERGILDAVSSLPYAHVAYKLHEVTNWYTTNLALSTAASPVLASTKSMNALPPQYRKLIADSAPGVVERWARVLLEDDIKGVELFKARGMQAITYADSELQQLRLAIKPIWDDWIAEMSKRGLNGQELIDLMVRSARNAKMPS